MLSPSNVLVPRPISSSKISDFAVALEPTNENSYYHLTDGNAFVGNSTAPSQMEDGVNCHGLAVGLTAFYGAIWMLMHPFGY